MNVESKNNLDKIKTTIFSIQLVRKKEQGRNSDNETTKQQFLQAFF
jgi:hypothetical protein